MEPTTSSGRPAGSDTRMTPGAAASNPPPEAPPHKGQEPNVSRQPTEPGARQRDGSEGGAVMAFPRASAASPKTDPALRKARKLLKQAKKRLAGKGVEPAVNQIFMARELIALKMKGR